jgi:hypothetical protein
MGDRSIPNIDMINVPLWTGQTSHKSRVCSAAGPEAGVFS